MKCIIVLKGRSGSLTEGFEIIGPFVSDASLEAYARKNLKTPFWNEAPMTFIQPSPQELVDELRLVKA